ncbi:MAG: hypothetical protein C0494_16880, partial [Sphingobium sp.]|nr:hypothetical protein [Sphingobium sp.]
MLITPSNIKTFIEANIGTAAFRALLDDANVAAMRSTLGLVIGTDVQAHDADLDALAALATTTWGRALLTLADASALRALLGSGY